MGERYKPGDLFMGTAEIDRGEWGWDGKVWAKPTPEELAAEEATRGTAQEYIAEPWEVATFTEAADARLFMAAPDLLAALKGLLTACSRLDEGGGERVRAACGVAEAAIRAAEGTP